MTRTWLRVLSLLACLSGLHGCGKSTMNPPAWQPEIMETTSGTTRTLSAAEQAGKTIVVNYWASWCKPCLQEIPELNAFAAAHKADVIVLAMNFDQPAQSTQRSAAQQAGIHYALLLQDPTHVLGINDITGLPTSVIISSDGKVKQVLAGPQTLANLEAVLQKP